MHVLIPGGSGQVGEVLRRGLVDQGHDVTILSRSTTAVTGQCVHWDGKTLGPWTRCIDESDVVINLAGRSVNCRYTKHNLQQMMDSRVDSAGAIGAAIARSATPPRVWLQMSTATIYAHRFDADNNDVDGHIGGTETDAPAYWKFSIDIAQAWEQAQLDAATPETRRVALRTAMVMSPDAGGIFDVLSTLARSGLGGTIAGGHQYISWIHEYDFVRAVATLIDQESITGPVNLASPHPLPQRDFMAQLRRAWGVPIGLPATKWMAEIGALFMRTDTELVLKSRRVVPRRLLDVGFEFAYADWTKAVEELVRRKQSIKPRLSLGCGLRKRQEYAQGV